MIYTYPTSDQPIRQGDVFVQLPRVELSLRELQILGDEEGDNEQVTWQEVLQRGDHKVTAMVGMRPTTAIVITQDCDGLRARDITLCEIRGIGDVTGYTTLPATPKKWVDFLRKRSQENQKWFYLPPDERLGFHQKMAVDFQVTLSIPRTDLEALLHLRTGRLNDEADEHFRERLAEFFRRYPVDEWYPYNREEFAAYQSEYSDVQPRHYQ